MELKIATWELPGAPWSPSAGSPRRHSFLFRVIIRAPVWKDGNVAFIALYHTTARGTLTQPHAAEMYCKSQSNLTCSKLPAWLSEQQVKGCNCRLSWTAVFLWGQHPLLETQETHCFLFRIVDAALPESMLPERESWYSVLEVAHLLEKNAWFHLTSSHQAHPTEHLIWAQPFMDRHLVILHLYCLCSALLSRIR